MVSFAGDTALSGGDGTVGPSQASRGLLSDSFASNAGSGGGGAPGGPSLFPQIGKLPVNTLGGAPFDPGDFSNFDEAKDPNEGGLFGHILGGLGGITGNEDIANVGRGIGHLLDVPLGAVGEVAGLPGALITSLPFLAGRGGFDPAFQKRYDESVRNNPLNALLELGHVARAQYQDDVETGKRPGLTQDFGPATNIADQLGLTLSLLSLPQRIVARTVMERGKEGDIAAIERGDATITNPFYKDLQARYERGDFGPQGSKQARDAMLDSMAIGGQLFHTATSAPKDGWGFLGQTLVDIAGSLLTDPLIIGDFGLGLLSKTATAAGAAKATKVLNALDDADRAAAATKAVDLIATERSIGQDAASHLFETESTIRHRALMDVIKADYPDRVAAATEGLTYTQKWASSVEPALRPIIDVVHRINDPLSLFGRGHANEVVGKVFDQHATEGHIRAFGFDNVIPMLAEADSLSPELGTALREGLGNATAITGRNWMKTELAKDAKRVGGVPLKYSPTALVQAGLSRLRGEDIATRIEMYSQRYKPLYLALGRGKEAEAAALADARSQAAERMGLMSNISPEEASGFAQRLNREQIAAIDSAYFGHTAREFVSARTGAMNGLGRVAKGLSRSLAEKLTIIGPRELTEERAKAVLAAITAGDEAAVREAVSTYDFLFENFAEHSLSTKALFEDVGTVIRDQLDHGGLTKSLSEAQALPTDLARWAERNRPLGYTLGFRPDDEAIWRSTMQDGKLIAVNPWIDLTAEAGEAVGTYNRAQLGKERLWHNIRGEKIVLDARHNFARYTSTNWGLNRHQADTLFARILKVSSEANHAPRGMSPEQIYHIVTTSHLPEEITSGLTQREAVEALLLSFEGDFWHVGVAQKFTGKAKTELGMSSNYIGQLAERVYPMVRFTLNPIFQTQELVEPFFLNILRGVKPGFRASDEDKATIALIDRVIRHEKYAFDDQIERTAMLLAGGQATKSAFGPTTRLGKFSKRLLANDLVNIKAIKQVNYARLAREQFGIELHDSFKQVAPDLIHALESHYGTADWGTIAVKYLTEKAAWGDGKKAYLSSVIDATKQNGLGARSIVNLDDLAKGHFDLPDGAALRSALKDGTLTDSAFRNTLDDFKADPDFVARALTVAHAPFTADEWWKGYLHSYANGNLREEVLTRSLVKERAKVLGVSEHEYLARRFSTVPAVAGSVPGSGVLDAEGKAFLAAAANPDRRKGLADLSTILTKDLDPSGMAIVKDAFDAAAPAGKTMEQWFADGFSTYIEGGVAPVKELRPAFEYFRKWLHQLNLTAEKQASRETFEATRKTYLTEARTVLRDEKLARTGAARDLAAAEKTHARAAAELKRARGRSGIAEREAKLARAKVAVQSADAHVGIAENDLRAAIAETQLAERKVAAANPHQRGGFIATRNRKTAELRAKTDVFNEKVATLQTAQRKAKDASANLSAAKRRTPIKSFEDKEARARAGLRFHEGRTRDASGRITAAQRDVARIEAARDTSKVVRKVETSPEMKGVFDSLFKPGEKPAQHHLSGVDIGQAFDIQHEAVYRAAEMALRRAEETAFRVQYYKRGRNFVERSINHPYFGLYPASYMWGKTLPELIRFMVAKPFGIDAPLGGLALSNSVYRSVMVQQNLDPEYRKFLAKQAPTFQFASMLAPALPWEVPVNAPLWLRRVAEVDAANEQRVKAGAAPKRFNAQDFGRTLGDVATYAFGPAYLAQELGKAAQLTGDFGNALAGAGGDIADNLGDVFAGNPGPAAPFEPGGG